MKLRAKIKKAVDILMTVAVLAQMAYYITGQLLHEWLGTVLFLLLSPIISSTGPGSKICTGVLFH